MPYIPPEVVAEAKEMDLLTYLKNYEPGELVRFSGDTYCTREHDSLKISNGKWCWFSRGIGGRTALDYLIKVKELPFTEAVERIVGHAAVQPPVYAPAPKKPAEKVLLLPQASRCATHIVSYLTGRGIDSDLIDFCISTGRLYESGGKYHNVVFVGHDRSGKARYANLRGIGSNFKGECNGSDKRFAFNIPAENSGILHLFESAIDLLSFATIRKLNGMDWRKDHLLSLAGVYQPREKIEESSIRELPPYVFTMIGLYAGLRREEILGLQWDCVFLDAPTPYISVRRAWRSEKNRPVVSTVLKTKAAKRDIPIPQRLVACLREAKASSNSDYVITDSNGQPLSYSQFHRVWQYVVVRSTKERVYYKYVNGQGIRCPVKPTLGGHQKNNPKLVYSIDFDVTPHQLRHTYITNLLYAGVDPKTVQYLAGHENSKTTMDIYAKVKYNKPEQLVGVVNAAFSQ